MMKEEEFLEPVQKALEKLIGPRPISMDTLLRRDLNLESIDLVELGFEIEEVLGLPLHFQEFLLELRTLGTSTDIKVSQVTKHLARVIGEK